MSAAPCPSCGSLDRGATETQVPRQTVKPLYETTENIGRPPLSTLGDCLAEVARCEPIPCTKITAAAASHWHDTAPDTIYLDFQAATECVQRGDDVTVVIRKGVTVARARAALKGIRAQLKSYDSLEQFTPKEPPPPDGDSVPF